MLTILADEKNGLHALRFSCEKEKSISLPAPCRIPVVLMKEYETPLRMLIKIMPGTIMYNVTNYTVDSACSKFMILYLILVSGKYYVLYMICIYNTTASIFGHSLMSDKALYYSPYAVNCILHSTHTLTITNELLTRCLVAE